MKQTEKAQDIARAFYEVLTRTALEQLEAAAQNLQGDGEEQDASLQKQIESALPSDALPQVSNFLLSLANEGELDNLALIVEAYEHLIQLDTEAVHAVVTSAVSLSEEQREHISDELQKQQGVDPENIRFTVDESLIGGLIIRIGDRVFDNSLRSRLGVVQRSMMMS